MVVIVMRRRGEGGSDPTGMAPAPGRTDTRRRLVLLVTAMAVLGILVLSPQISTLAFLIAVKTAIDLHAHVREHEVPVG